MSNDLLGSTGRLTASLHPYPPELVNPIPASLFRYTSIHSISFQTIDVTRNELFAELESPQMIDK